MKKLKLSVNLIVLSIAVIINILLFVHSITAVIEKGNIDSLIGAIFTTISLICFSLWYSVEIFSKLKISDTIKYIVYLYILFFIAIIPSFNLFGKLWIRFLFWAYSGILFSITSLSLFYYFTKNQFGKVKPNTTFLIFFVTCISICFGLVFEMIFNFIAESSFDYYGRTVNQFFIDFSFMIIGIVISDIIYVISNLKNKILLNTLLVMKEEKN